VNAVFGKRADLNNTSKFIIGLGALVTGLGRLVGGKAGYWLRGFGLAHIVLGSINIFRPILKNQ